MRAVKARHLKDSGIEVYPGLASFSDTPRDHDLLFGRDEDLQRVLDTVLSSSLSILFSRSGLGKTSLINAKVCPELRDRRFLPVTFRPSYDLQAGPVAGIVARIRQEAVLHDITVTGPQSSSGLWSFLHESTFKMGARNFRPVLILDQFEEVFTILRPSAPHGEMWTHDLIREVADLARRRVPEDVRQSKVQAAQKLDPEDEGRKQIMALLYGDALPEVKVLISIREDFLADLGTLQGSLPGLLQNSIRLQP
ncbi:MAG TPA: hypothetical protein VM120_10695, partial [Bryobacteraceae bacterium]|nr:hypothetical protein [Bryobacteraceae bacterium]